MSKLQILNFDREALTAELADSLGLPAFRAKQLIQWLYRYRSRSFDEMSNISKEVRSRLGERYEIYRPKIKTLLHSKDGSKKFLFELQDGSLIESVLIKQATRSTICVSSQVGCAIGCKFCRTGLMGLTRHLQTHEIIGQVLAVKDEIQRMNTEGEGVEDFENIVFMGMGEPLHNFEHVRKTVNLLNDELGLNFSSRKITVSTSGLVPEIRRFGEEGLAANLAVSLNATTDEIRTRLIPINKKWPLSDLLQTLREFPLRNRKRITIEYVMLQDVNDSDADLARLPALLRGIPVKINLIPYNNNTGLGLSSSSNETIHRWQKALLAKGLNATIRWSKGDDISAACGQLATESSRKRSRPEQVQLGA